MPNPPSKRTPASQRREFHRVEILMPVSYKLMSEHARGSTARPELGSTLNLSMGGMLLGTDKELEPRSRLFCTFKLLPGEAEVWIESQVLDCAVQTEGAVFKYISHLRFEHPGRETEQALGRFIMIKQKETRRR